ncbi:LysR family transcriptional regulator [Thiomicrorhabdus immobilis]|uniref:LysR family transcriptional regulator n=1 Tax=Thiomicrorhabdus immobilis TaxID=2791037 RepID=A0ABN6D0B7_9GAMM|nr:LysR family transcriptional regulator [Thiomicrorhabdus immobilis]BCN94364.1 LysR family transcriptional regulator [Thiomicrorhabdus immobilis]
MTEETFENANSTNFLIRHASLRQIQIFESVARNLSFTRAAEELFLTQPTVSAQVKSLVEAIEMPLYEQLGRQIHLTEVGEQVACSCRDVMRQLSNLETTLDEFKGLKRGRLRISVISTAKYFAPLVLGEFCKQYPKTELGLEIINRENIFKRIMRNMDDLYILGQIPPSDMELNVIPFSPNPLVIIAHKEHPLVGQKVSLKRLAKEPFLMREEGSGIRLAVEKRFANQDLKVNQRLVLDSNEAIKQCVNAELGVACVSKHALQLHSNDSPFAILDVEGFPIEKQWNIVYPKNKQLSVIANEFLSFLLDKGMDFIKLPK